MDHEPGPVRGDRTVAFRREVALVETVLTALAPVVVTLLLGFVAAWHHDFAAKDAAVLNRMVLLYAVPVALFVGTVGTPRSELVQDVAFAVAMCVAIVGMYALVFLFFRLALRFSLGESVLAALAASAPAAPLRLFSATYLAKRAPFPSRLPLSSLTLSLCQSQCSVSRWRKRPSHRRRTRRSATRVFRKSFGKRSKNRSYGHRYSLSRSFCATSKSLRFSAMDFRF
jgi:hypothetical protein